MIKSGEAFDIICNPVGILTDEASLIDAACEQFDSVRLGDHCTRCGRRQYCPTQSNDIDLDI